MSVIPVPESAPSLTSSELEARLQAFEREFLREKSSETIGTYRRALNKFEEYVRGLDGPFRFEAKEVERYKAFLETKLEPASVSTYLTAVRQFCAYLVEIGLLEANPAKKVRGNARPKKHSREVLSPEDVAQLEAAFDIESLLGLRDRAIACLMLYAGLSEIEIVRADVADLEQTLLGPVLRVQGKGRRKKDQQVSLDDRAVDAVQAYLASRGRLRPLDPLFASHGRRSEGERLNTRSLRTRISELLERAGVKRDNVSPHSLTHTAPLLWLDAGMSIEEVGRRMRHGTEETTRIYERRLAEIADGEHAGEG